MKPTPNFYLLIIIFLIGLLFQSCSPTKISQKKCEELLANKITNQLIISFNDTVDGPVIERHSLALQDTFRTYVAEEDFNKVKIKTCPCNPNVQLLEFPDTISITPEERRIVAEATIEDEGNVGFNVEVNLDFDANYQPVFTEPNPDFHFDKPNTPTGDVTIAVIDNGIDFSDSLLAKRMWAKTKEDTCFHDGGYDFTGEHRTLHKLNKTTHGTLVAKIIASNYSDSIALNIMDLRIFDSLNKSSLFDIVCATHYAIDNGAEVINMSFGYYQQQIDKNLLAAFVKAKNKGVVIVTSAGNDSLNTDIGCLHLPSYFQTDSQLGNVISVAAMDTSYNSLASWSNYGILSTGIAASGVVHIENDDPEKSYMLIDKGVGTSFAAPQVTRIVSMVMGMKKYNNSSSTNNLDITKCILNVAYIPESRLQVKSGGIVNEKASLKTCN